MENSDPSTKYTETHQHVLRSDENNQKKPINLPSNNPLEVDSLETQFTADTIEKKEQNLVFS